MTAIEPPIAESMAAPIATRRRLVTLIVLSVVFAMWVAALLWMYFATVYPQRHPKDGRPAVVAPGR